MKRTLVMVSSSRAAHRRYIARIGAAMVAYLVSLAAALQLVGGGAVNGPLAYVLAALPGLAVVGVFWAYARLLIEETDEYRRMLLVGQSLVATAFTLSIVTVYGFLENFDLVPQVDGFYVAVLWFVGLGVGSVVNRFSPRGAAGDGCL
jgi:FtsH-binding integral membrane protein